ncbi:MAG: hypothetical protein ACP5OO_01050 [Chloroflexia bacterium]
MKKRVLVLVSVLFVVLLLLSACGGGATSLVGKWSATEPSSGTKIITIEFKADGKLAMGSGDLVLDVGTYKVLSASQVELAMDFMGTQQTQTLNYRFEGAKLILSDPTDPSGTLELTRE